MTAPDPEAAIRDVEQRFHGFKGSPCGEHRTVGSHRAWCFDCGEWCYPSSPCRGCESVTPAPDTEEG